MEPLLKIIAGVLTAVVLGLALGRDMSVLLSLAVCAMGMAALLEFVEPILSLLRGIGSLAQLQGETLEILAKILGIGFVSEVAGMVCADAGNASLAKLVKLLSCAGILWLSIPVFQMSLSILQEILGNT